MNYALDTPTKRKVYVPEDVPFAPAYSPPINQETDNTHRAMTWQFDKRQQVVGNQPIPESGRRK